jgi:hypothetical protein
MTTALNTAMSTAYSTKCWWLLITIGVALMDVGVAMVRASGPRHRRRRTRTASSRARLSAALLCAAVTGGLITGMQWAVLSQTGPAAWVAVLGPPAFLAGASVTRLLLLVLEVSRQRHRRARTVRERSGR